MKRGKVAENVAENNQNTGVDPIYLRELLVEFTKYLATEPNSHINDYYMKANRFLQDVKKVMPICPHKQKEPRFTADGKRRPSRYICNDCHEKVVVVIETAEV